MKVFPTKKQWRGWKFPTRLGVIVAYVTITMAIIYVSDLLISSCKDPVTKNDLADSDKTVIDTVTSLIESLKSTEVNYSNYLESKYDLGYCLIGFTHNNITIPHNSRISYQIEVDWGGIKISEIMPNRIVVNISRIYHKSANALAENNNFYINRIPGSSNFMILYDFKATVEYLGENSEGIICVLGFQTDEL